MNSQEGSVMANFKSADWEKIWKSHLVQNLEVR